MWFDNSSQHSILSISGWRFKFPSTAKRIKIPIDDLTTMYFGITAYVKAKTCMQSISSTSALTLSIACDTRATSSTLLYFLQATLRSLQCSIANLGVLPLPAIIAHTKSHSDGFIYITASHNPPEYNGIKFGSASGRVQSTTEYNAMMKIFSDFVTQHPQIPKTILEFNRLIENEQEKLNEALLESINNEQYALACNEYKKIIHVSVFKGLPMPGIDFNKRRELYIKSLKGVFPGKDITKLGVILDSNGGARTWDFDKTILEELGISLRIINDTPGDFAHSILPENESLSQAESLLLSLNKNSTGDTYWMCAVVCDCDGDRGNTIYYKYHNNTHSTIVQSPQEVFAVALTVELAWANYMNKKNNAPDSTIAVAINGPSSLRCNVIANRYQAYLFRSEVGEANLVELSENIRKKNINVPIIGEASNGGVILYPSMVRDPLCTVLASIKGVLWADKLELPENLPNILSTVPEGHSTSTEDPLAKFSFPQNSYSEIISLVFQNFSKHFILFATIFQDHDINIADYCFVNFRGTQTSFYEKNNIPSTIDSGGIAIYFYNSPYVPNAENNPVAFVWLRPSGTEPVVRLMADVLHEDAEQIERALIQEWKKYLTRVVGTS